MKALNLVGNKYGKLTVIKRDGSKYQKSTWLCKCECGNEIILTAGDLKSGNTKSCGCLQKELLKIKNTTHNLRNHRLYKIWADMKGRCNRKTHCSYKDYGARGIRVCEEWKNDFMNFYNWAIENGYDENAKRGECTIDRINNDGNYEPSNCRWVDMKVQANNRRKRIC